MSSPPRRPEPGKPPSSRQRATALRFDAAKASAPTVTASGRGLIAERIVAEARSAGVPVREDAALAEALGGLELGHQVPEELWVAVAETLAWAYTLDRRARSALEP